MFDPPNQPYHPIKKAPPGCSERSKRTWVKFNLAQVPRKGRPKDLTIWQPGGTNEPTKVGHFDRPKESESMPSIILRG